MNMIMMYQPPLVSVSPRPRVQSNNYQLLDVSDALAVHPELLPALQGPPHRSNIALATRQQLQWWPTTTTIHRGGDRARKADVLEYHR